MTCFRLASEWLPFRVAPGLVRILKGVQAGGFGTWTRPAPFSVGAQGVCTVDLSLSKPVEAKPKYRAEKQQGKDQLFVRRDKRGIQPKVQAAVTVLLEVNARFPTALGE